MNVNRVYIAKVYVNSSYDFLAPGVYRMHGSFVKPAVVYHRIDGKYLDLDSKEVYRTNTDGKLGEMFVNTAVLIPFYDAVESTKLKKENLSKKKILKLLYEEAVKREGEVEKNEESI